MLKKPAFWDVYINHGWRIFPVYEPLVEGCSCGEPICPAPGKHPRIQHWQALATTDQRKIQEWFLRWRNANVGLATGAASRIFVLDIDPKNGGEESVAALEREIGGLPPTVEAQTGGGGRHLLYRHPGERVANYVGNAATLGCGIDIRGDGGFVVVPPSIHRSGRLYKWRADRHPDNYPVAIAPPVLLERLRTASLNKPKAPSLSWHQLIARGVEQGSRNDAIARLSGHLLRCHDAIEVVELMLCFNAVKCRPPLSQHEVVEIVSSIARAELKKRRERVR